MADTEKDEQSALDQAKDFMSRAIRALQGGNRKKKPRKAKDVPLGKGIAEKGKETVGGRKRQLDKAIEDAGG